MRAVLDKVVSDDVYGRARTGLRDSMMEYVHRRRMELAKEFLQTGLMNVGQVSDMVGYQNPQHFSTAYKKRFGVSPSHVSRRLS